MSDCLEVLFVSNSSEKSSSIQCFNPHVGTTLMTYKGNGSAKRCTSIIGDEYLISAQVNKPILQVWPLNSQEPCQELKMIIPGKPTALSVSPDGHYCVAGIDGKIFVWQISSGILLNVVSRHYQPINKLIFTDDSVNFISAGEDGLILVWRLADVVAKQCGNLFKLNICDAQPFYTFSHHSLPVTDIFVGNSGRKSRLFSVSPDQTCKIHCLSSGELLLSIVFEFVLTSVTVNEIETHLFVGTNCGKIQVFELDSYPRTLEHHVSNDTELSNTFTGHTKAITSLAISFDSATLASASDDEKVFLWNIPSRQLLRSFEIKGPISDMFFHFASRNIFSSNIKPQFFISKFDKISNLEDKPLMANVWVQEDLQPISLLSKFKNQNVEVSEKQEDDIFSMKEEIDKLKEINKQLYQFAMNKIIENPLAFGINNCSMNNKEKS